MGVPKRVMVLLNASVIIDGGGGGRTSHAASMKTAWRMRRRANARSIEELHEERGTVGSSGVGGQRGLVRSLGFGRGRVWVADEFDRLLLAGPDCDDRGGSSSVAGERVADGDGRGSCLW